MRTLITICYALLLFVTYACASEQAGDLNTRTTEPQQVDPKSDNAQVTNNLIPGLLITIEIDSTSVSVAEARVAMVPRGSIRQNEEGEFIRLIGIRDGKEVTTVSVPDQRLNTQEGTGIVIQEQRTIVAVLPLTQKLDQFTIQLPGKKVAGQPERFDVSKQIEEYCSKNPNIEFCE